MILAIDTSGAELLLALVDGGVIVAGAVGPGGRHQEAIGATIAEVVDGRGGLAAVDAIAVVVGPGSHTGLRVGLSTASGIAYARRLKLYPLSSLVVAAHRAGDADRLLAAVAAGRGRIYIQEFTRAGSALVPAGVRGLVTLAELAAQAQVHPVGAAPALLVEAGIAPGDPVPGPEALAAAAISAAGSGHGLAYHQLAGEYS